MIQSCSRRFQMLLISHGQANLQSEAKRHSSMQMTFVRPSKPAAPVRPPPSEAIPCRLLFLSPDDPVRLLGSSLPIVGRTLSLADRLTNSAKGTSQTQRPKNEEISVKVGKLLVSYLERGGTRGTEKCLNQRKWLRRTRTTQGRQRVQLLTCNFRNEKCLPQ